MSRVVLHHLTPVGRLPAIEVEGLRTRADLSTLLGPIDAFDEAAPGTFARGKRVTGWFAREHALAQVGALGRGLVTYSVDPARALAQPASAREADPAAAWALARPLAAWLGQGTPPADLEVHVNLPVRAKHVRIHAPLVDDAVLGDWAPLVDAIADSDRVAAKLVMHMAIAASEGDTHGRDFLAACALAWRDEPDGDDLARRQHFQVHRRRQVRVPQPRLPWPHRVLCLAEAWQPLGDEQVECLERLRPSHRPRERVERARVVAEPLLDEGDDVGGRVGPGQRPESAGIQRVGCRPFFG